MGIYVYMYVHKYTNYRHTYVAMDQCVYVYAYILYG